MPEIILDGRGTSSTLMITAEGAVPISGEIGVNIENLGSEAVITAGSVQPYAQLGSVEVWQETNSKMQVQSTQETNPWIVLGSTRMIPGDRVPGSIVDMPIVGISGTVVGVSGIVNQGTTPWGILGSVKILSSTGSVEVFQTTNADMQVQASQEGTWDINNLLTGSVRVVSQNEWTGVGSVRVTNIVGVSGTAVAISGVVNQGTNPWIINGSVNINNFTVLGSSRVISQVSPLDSSQNNSEYSFLYITSGTSAGVTGSRIGSVIQFIGAGSFVQKWTYVADKLTNVGSWV